LQDRRIFGDIDNVITNSRISGIRRLLCCGSEENDWEDVARIRAKYGRCGDDGRDDRLIICAYGVHPWYVDQVSDDWDTVLKECLHNDPSAAVGEIGLDNAINPRNDDKQIDIFTRQLKIAEQFKRPVSIHCRKAWGSLVPILKDMGGLRYGGAIHSYSGSHELIAPLQDLGCYISFSASILIPGNKRAVESLQKVSPDRLLVETDSPDIPPPNLPGPHNEPANLRVIVEKIAELLGKTVEEVAELTYGNGIRCFGSLLPEEPNK
jgi:TatD DNase family protein